MGRWTPAIHRSEHLTVLAGSLPPGFRAAPHNHNIWSVVAVCGGQEDNQFFERYGGDLFSTPRSNWDPDTHQEIPFDWNEVKSGGDS